MFSWLALGGARLPKDLNGCTKEVDVSKIPDYEADARADAGPWTFRRPAQSWGVVRSGSVRVCYDRAYECTPCITHRKPRPIPLVNQPTLFSLDHPKALRLLDRNFNSVHYRANITGFQNLLLPLYQPGVGFRDVRLKPAHAVPLPATDETRTDFRHHWVLSLVSFSLLYPGLLRLPV